MNRFTTLASAFALAALIGVATTNSTSLAQPKQGSLKDDLLGSWRLISNHQPARGRDEVRAVRAKRHRESDVRQGRHLFCPGYAFSAAIVRCRKPPGRNRRGKPRDCAGRMRSRILGSAGLFHQISLSIGKVTVATSPVWSQSKKRDV
jgi:hypothetical protein